MEADEIIEELWWEARNYKQEPTEDNLKELLEKVWSLGDSMGYQRGVEDI